MKKAVLYILAFIAIELLVSWAVSFVWLLVDGNPVDVAWRQFTTLSSSGIDAPLFITQTAAYSIVIMVVFLVCKWSVASPHYLRERQWAVFAWAVVAAIGTMIPSMALQDAMPDVPDITKEAFSAIIRSDFGYTAICIFAPLVEELVFRGAVLRSLLSSNMGHPALAIVVSAVFFAAVHFNPAQMPHAFLVGLLLGWMYFRTGSILPGVAFHWTNNTITFVVCRLAPHLQDMTLLEIFQGNMRSMVLSIFFSLMILIPALYQLNIRMKKV